MSKFLTFRKFDTPEEAIAISELLKEKNIPVELENTPVLLDQQLIGQQFENTFLLKIPADYFRKADGVLRAAITVDEQDVEEDYYLLSFSDKELQEVIEKKDEWGSYDYTLALQLLEKRGISYTPVQLAAINDKRLQQLATPERGNVTWIVIGYMSVAIGGLLGFFIGAYIIIAKKTLPDGTRMFAYSEETRKQGKYILILGAVVFPLWVLYVLNGGSIPGVTSLLDLLSNLRY
ncbi:hypothetical protein GFS24_21210 [Chitinophaga sp. SYP-B3965]|uniref:hypothetical protein n=1 Tax=Chitinophaga sp. SYP-B3965 TaxID=2663120 RepID=UPI0012999A0C|nr:hypothetical protein [Chitinophaga sp. SYP-B3965]MRG47656.1 hypothetical protein [Chitinophaga sp. SYP-B3965]